MNIAVKMRDCNFSYGKGERLEKVLDGVNLTVPSGVIYALLGPSGCGKTTLLKIISAQLKGQGIKNVWIFGCQPGSQGSVVPGPGIGYMPQELSLYEDLTIVETLRLFGRLNIMKEKDINERILEMFQVLELPSSLKKKLIKNLSGGQQRRVSLASALLHNPPLLILDEPTVGVDPLLRKQIWSYLVNITATKQTTIIITTHYIEEAKDADIVGAMRMGRILVEASPQLIMSSFKDNSLDSCFYKMCYIDTSNSQQLNDESTENTVTRAVTSTLTELKAKSVLSEHSGTRNSSLDGLPTPPHYLYRVKHLIKRNFIMRWRNRPLVAFQISIPLISLICWCTCVGREMSGVRCAIINQETPLNLSTDFINHLDTDIINYKYYDFEAGINSVVSGENQFALHIKPDFTKCLLRRIELGLDVDNETLNCSSVSAYFDTTSVTSVLLISIFSQGIKSSKLAKNDQKIGITNKPNEITRIQAEVWTKDHAIFYAVYNSLVFGTSQALYQNVFTDLGASPALAALPVDFSEVIVGEDSQHYGDFTISGIIFMVIYFLSAGSMALVIVNEKRHGLADKLWTTAVTWPDILISQVITEVFYTIIQSLLLLLYMVYVYGLVIKGSALLLLILVVLQGCAGMGLGLLFSSMIRPERLAMAILLLFAVQFVHCFTNGLIWPLESQSLALRSFSRFLALTQPNEAFKAILFRGWGLENLTVLLGFLSTAVWFTIYFGLSSISLLR